MKKNDFETLLHKAELNREFDVSLVQKKLDKDIILSLEKIKSNLDVKNLTEYEERALLICNKMLGDEYPVFRAYCSFRNISDTHISYIVTVRGVKWVEFELCFSKSNGYETHKTLDFVKNKGYVENGRLLK